MSYIGQGLGQGQAERFVFTAAGGETSVTLDDSGRGVAYTVGQVDVYLNGVKLVNGTDFTATTGSSITGLSALSASDVVDIVALSTFDVADTVSKSSGGTFDSAVSFDAGVNTDTISEKTAAAGVTIDGVLLKDGDISAVDATLSGGVYLGGSGAANYLDDYEEGYYQPTMTTTSSGTITVSSAHEDIKYTKIGRVVYLSGRIKIALVSSPTGSVRISLPFALETGTDESGYSAFPMFTHGVNLDSGTISLFGETLSGSSYMTIFQMKDAAAWTALPASNLTGSGSEYFYFNGYFPTSS